MAWLQKRGRIWWLGYYVGGRMVRKTLATEDEAIARRELEKVTTLESAKASGAALEPLFESLTGRSIPKPAIKEEIESWLREVKRTTSEGTASRYGAASARLIESLKADDRGPLLRDVTAKEIHNHLDTRFDETSAATANLERKILRIFFKRATDAGLLKENPILAVKRYRDGVKKKRKRAFEAKELSLLYAAASGSHFWQYMILGGFYTGQRMGDLATLEIEHVDFEKAMVSREMGKVGKTVHVPLTPILCEAIKTQIGERKSGAIWPKEAAEYRKRGSPPFSSEFYDLLVLAGLAEKRSHEKKAGNRKGRSVPHDKSGISFHSIRHSFVSMLKRSGATQAVAKALAGHTSDSVNELYTHIPAEALAHAVAQLPSIT